MLGFSASVGYPMAEQIAAADGGLFFGFPRYQAQQAAAAELWR
jgi:hypothetical protein